MRPLPRWIAGGLTAGLFGAAIWIVTTYFTGFELGILAMGIGALSGLGVKLFAEESPRKGHATTAVVVAIVSIGAAKVGHLVVSWPGTEEGLREGALLQLCALVARDEARAGRPVERPDKGWEIRHTDYPEKIRVEAERRWNAFTPDEQAWYLQDVGYVFLLNEELAIAKLALVVVEEYETKELTVKWPTAANRQAPGGRDDFPAEIWQEAVTRWEGFSPEERREFEELIAFAFYFGAIFDHILAVFSLMDILWIILAATTAWQVALSAAQIRLGRFGVNPIGDVLSKD